MWSGLEDECIRYRWHTVHTHHTHHIIKSEFIHLGFVACDCEYKSQGLFLGKGCVISLAAPEGYKCECTYTVSRLLSQWLRLYVCMSRAGDMDVVDRPDTVHRMNTALRTVYPRHAVLPAEEIVVAILDCILHCIFVSLPMCNISPIVISYNKYHSVHACMRPCVCNSALIQIRNIQQIWVNSPRDSFRKFTI